MEFGIIRSRNGFRIKVKTGDKVGQGDVIKFLEICDKPVTRTQIAEGMAENPIKVSHILANLIKWGEVHFVEYSGDRVKELAGYFSGRRTRFYFVKKE